MPPWTASLAIETLRLAVWLAVLAAVFIPLERLFAERPQSVFRRQMLPDLVYFFGNGLALSLLLAIPAALLAALSSRIMPRDLFDWIAALPLWVRLPAAMFIGDLGAYWGHRWSHERPILWRFHAIHHSATEVDWLTNTRAHPVDLVFTRFCALVPLYALGLAQAANAADPVAMLVTVIGTFWSFFIHANLKWRLGWLERLISTPAFHRWHHTNDEMRDRNYAALFPVLDLIFRSFHLPAHAPSVYGIDAAMPPGVVAQLLSPLSAPKPPE